MKRRFEPQVLDAGVDGRLVEHECVHGLTCQQM